MFYDRIEEGAREHFEISARFRRIIEQRISRLESDAGSDELLVALLENEDHIRRHVRLVAAQREEASRMRRFLENTHTRVPESQG